MFDLETLSTASNANILSIGACVFGDGLSASKNVPRTFYVNVDDRTGHIDVDTVMWWFRQSKDAQVRLDSLTNPRVSLEQALFQFACWCSMHVTGDMLGIQDKKAVGNGVEFWSRSPSFDEVILTSAYRRADSRSPFFHRWSRDCRTIEVAAGIPYDDSFMGGLVHDALNDAQCQARHVEACLRRLEALKPSAALVQRPADAPGC